jgi:hypothetical protein
VQRLLYDGDIAGRAADLGATLRADAEASTVVDHLESMIRDTPRPLPSGLTLSSRTSCRSTDPRS